MRNNLRDYMLLEQELTIPAPKELFDQKKKAHLSMDLALKNKDIESYQRHRKDVKDINDKIRRYGLRVRNVQKM